MRALLLLLVFLVGCTPVQPVSTQPPVVEAFTATPLPTLTAAPTFTVSPSRTFTPTSIPAPTQTSTLTPQPSPTPVCPGAPSSSLAVGQVAMVSLDPPLSSRLREQPGLDGKISGQALAGQEMEILAGPECADDYVWWQVRLLGQNLVGWTVEGDASGPWLITPTPVPTLTPTPQPGACPPYPVQTSLPNPADPADAASYLGKIFRITSLPTELLFRRGTVVDLAEGLTVVQVEIKSTRQVLLWLERRACRDVDGQPFATVTDARVLPPLEPGQVILVSSVDRCTVGDENDPRLVVLGKVDSTLSGTQPLKDLQSAWRVNLETGRLDEIPLREITCEYSSHGP